MKITAFICEFNPLHRGHQYFIKESRRQSGADYLIALMSGDFVQRGEPSVLPMHERAKAALSAGADLVIELPLPYATASAEYFARGGISILNALGCVDHISFGAECDNQYLLNIMADFSVAHESEIDRLTRESLAGGVSYAKARSKAILRLYSEYGSVPCAEDSLYDILQTPNNRLALAYMGALRKLDSTIKAIPITRDPAYASSSQIRRSLFSGEGQNCYLSCDDFSLLLKDRIMRQSAEELSSCFDVSADLANRIKNKENDFLSWTNFCDLLHTKEMTRARISRSLCHILLGIRKDDPLLSGEAPLPSRLRILGFRKSSSALLGILKDASGIPLFTSLPAEIKDQAADLYESVRTDRFGLPFKESHQQPVIIL